MNFEVLESKNRFGNHRLAQMSSSNFETQYAKRILNLSQVREHSKEVQNIFGLDLAPSAELPSW